MRLRPAGQSGQARTGRAPGQLRVAVVTCVSCVRSLVQQPDAQTRSPGTEDVDCSVMFPMSAPITGVIGTNDPVTFTTATHPMAIVLHEPPLAPSYETSTL